MKPPPPLRPWLLGLSLCALAGCSLLSGASKDPVTIYAPDVRVPADPAWPQAAWQLTIMQPSAARLVDSTRINVRPSPGELQVYRGVSWAQSSTDLLEDTLLRAFEDSGRIAGVARAGDGIRADYKLTTDLRRFESDYAGHAVPSATIELNAKLLHAADQRIVASRTFLVAEPAASTDTAAVATAFETALRKATHDLVGWTLASGQQDALAHPGTP
ncbi:MAG: ABC-type transport auxiliary lipoprotein family protein [Pseudomonas sp.]